MNPPRVANADAQAMLDALVDDPVGPANVRCTRSANHKKLVEALLETGSITEEEYGTHALCSSCHCSVGLLMEREKVNM